MKLVENTFNQSMLLCNALRIAVAYYSPYLFSGLWAYESNVARISSRVPHGFFVLSGPVAGWGRLLSGWSTERAETRDALKVLAQNCPHFQSRPCGQTQYRWEDASPGRSCGHSAIRGGMHDTDIPARGDIGDRERYPVGYTPFTFPNLGSKCGQKRGAVINLTQNNPTG